MGGNERLLVGGLVSLLLILIPGFLLHVSPRFPGSLGGGVLGLIAAALMLVAMSYPIFKRIAWLRRHVSMRNVLLVHVLAGIVGAVLGVLHTGHKFTSPLGIALIGLLLSVIISGFVGRYYMVQISTELYEQRTILGKLTGAFADMVARRKAESREADARGAVGSRQLAGWVLGQEADRRDTWPSQTAKAEVLNVVRAIADTEYEIEARETQKRAFGLWMAIHVAASVAFIALLGLHIWSSFYFGLRWLS